MSPTKPMYKTAIARKVGFGMRDTNQPVLWFDADMNGRQALLVLSAETALEVIKHTGVYDIKNLEGKPLTVDMSDFLVKFVSFWPNEHEA